MKTKYVQLDSDTVLIVEHVTETGEKLVKHLAVVPYSREMRNPIIATLCVGNGFVMTEDPCVRGWEGLEAAKRGEAAWPNN